MKRSTERILTTHTGSLSRPKDLLELIRQRESGGAYDAAALDSRLREAVAEVVKQQADSGIDVVTDGEFSKPSFSTYVTSRLSGFGGVSTAAPGGGGGMFANWPEYVPWRAELMGAQVGGATPGVPECNAPLGWQNFEAVQADIARLKDALGGVAIEEAFLPSASIGIIAQRTANSYYKTYEEYVYAIAGVMKDEYRAITDAGFILQIDAPEMVMDRNNNEYRGRPIEEYKKECMELWVDALNTALEGIPEDRVRFHICWGNQEGPHDIDVPLADIVDVMLRVNAGAYSVEACNPRHAHEWKVWRDVKLPEGKILIPGVIDSTTNFVEHPELVADRIETYAGLVGKENVIAGTDCGFGTIAFRRDAVFPPLIWAKFKAMAEGAEIATKRLWSR
jgi:5-methyltetrahydropteroyltriglutamate--homocysteine methyltransferase